MKKIVIVTWTGVHNYGTALQSFALQYAISKMGFDVCIMDKILNLSFVDRVRIMIEGFLLRIKKSKNSKFHKMLKFHRQFQKIVRPANVTSLEKLINDTDVFVSGSDQIWNVNHRYDPVMFLTFAGIKKRISYATSIGTSDISSEYAEMVNNHLRRYQHISVREETARECLTKLTARHDIVKVLDPTFLLFPHEWIEFANHSEMELPQSPYLLCYFVGNNGYEEKLNDVIRKSGIEKIVIVLLKGSLSFIVKGATIIDNASPNDFVSLILNSALLCTDSFHATAIAINFSKPFVELLRFQDDSFQSQNSRIYDLLDSFDLKDRLYRQDNEKWLMPSDYEHVQDKLNKERDLSWTYLKSSLEN